ncbi:MAG: hypothetical protein HY868_18490 [Chloroflexi bacterium]|nr:hypothetical protein [Chloroflexota bacterium]
MNDPSKTSKQESYVQRWMTALLQFDATLPRPIAEAMARNAMRGTVGNVLKQLDEGLGKLEIIRVEELAGSEARTILAVLIQMNQRVAQLQEAIRELWNPPDA